eukprot:RCo014733
MSRRQRIFSTVTFRELSLSCEAVPPSGVPALDLQHQTLLSMHNSLAMLCDAGQQTDSSKQAPVAAHNLRVVESLRRLLQSCERHLTAEQQVMRQAEYPWFSHTCTLHMEFSEHTSGWPAELLRGTVRVEDILGYLKTWLDEHVQGNGLTPTLAQHCEERHLDRMNLSQLVSWEEVQDQQSPTDVDSWAVAPEGATPTLPRVALAVALPVFLFIAAVAAVAALQDAGAVVRWAVV